LGGGLLGSVAVAVLPLPSCRSPIMQTNLQKFSQIEKKLKKI
jgi:hypothetical protein